jgi:hypothetical protein
MSQRQTVDFLRRRYAAAILCDDAATASRLRVQLDGIMNRTDGAGPCGGPQPEALPLGLPTVPLATEGSSGRSEPRLHLVMPVTGLLEGRRGR